MLEGIQEQGGAGAEQGTAFRGQDGAVLEFDGGGGGAGAGTVQAVLRRDRGHPVGRGDARPLHQEGDLVHLGFRGLAVGEVAEGRVVAADDFLQGGFAAHLVVRDAVAGHVHAHVRRGLVGGFAVDVHEQGVHHGEDLHVAVVVHRRLAVGFQVERVDHVHVLEVRRGGFVGEVHGVGEGEVPDGEGLELGVAGLDPALVLLVQLAQAHGHLAAAGAGGRDDDQGLRGLHIVVPAESFVGVDEGDIVRIAFDRVVVIDLDAHRLQAFPVGHGAGLAAEMGDDDAVHAEPAVHELVAETEDVHVVGDPEVRPDLVLLDVHGADDDDDLRVILHLHEHLELAVRLEARKDAAGVVIVE